MTIRLIEATDSDFAWMLGGSAVAYRDLALPPGGVDTAEILEHVRAVAQRVEAVQGHSDSWMIVDGQEVVGLCGVLEKTGFARIGTDVDPDDGEPIIRWRAGVGPVTTD